jgi:DNA-directed DNA polymerase III PolC
MLDALTDVNKLFDRVKELGQTAVAITDHGTMAAHIDAFKASKNTGVKFIPGCEMYFVNSYEELGGAERKGKTEKRKHIVLLAQNEKGYKNLLRANFIGFEHQVQVMGRVFPRINWSVLEEYSEGIICLTACANGLVSKAISENNYDEADDIAQRLLGIFKDRLYFELQPHHLKDKNINQEEINRTLIEMGGKFGIPLVAATDIHYLTRESEAYHDVLMAINSKKTVEDPERHRYGIDEFFIKSGEEVFDFLQKHYGPEVAHEAVSNTVKIANLCEDSKYIVPSKPHLPIFNVKDQPDYNAFIEWRVAAGVSEDLAEDKAYMRYMCIAGFKEKFNHLPKEDRVKRWARVKKEVKVLEGNNFSSYMLIVSDFIRWAEANSIMSGYARGSIAGCMVGYLLGIHKIDPLEYGLLFERFQNAQKKSFPDIDTDFTSAGRDLVVDYCKKKYGIFNCAQVSNINTYTPKNVIPDLVKSMRNVLPDLIMEGENYVRASNEIKAAIPEKDEEDKKVKTLSKALELSPELRLLAKKCPELMEYAENIVGLPKGYSTHAAGLVISDVPIFEFAPLRIDKDGVIAVQVEKERCELVGLIKMDLLGLSTLDIIEEALRNISVLDSNGPKSVHDIKLDDKEVYKMIGDGFTKCVFQLGKSSMMVSICKKFKPNNIVDLAVINALGRPSSSSEEREEFISRRFGKKPVSYLHPSLEKSLKDTYGFGVFEEQLLLLAQDVAGWDLNKADGLRKLTKLKGKDPELAKKLEIEFINGCMEKQNMSYENACDIWEKIVLPFAKYGFNKCLTGDTKVITSDESLLSILEVRNKINNEEKIMLKSYDIETRQFINDECLEVIDAEEQDVYEFALSNGEVVKCTMEHKFLCSDHKMHQIKDIVEFDMDILKEREASLKAISFKKIGKEHVYNLSMRGKNHNYLLEQKIISANSHAIAYSINGYITAYLKCKYPAAFMSAYLKLTTSKNSVNREDEILDAKEECKRLGIKIVPPDVNNSSAGYEVLDNNTIVMGLRSVKGMGDRAVEEIIDNQPFDSFVDFLYKTEARVLNKTRIDVLAKAGCFDSFNLSRKFVSDNSGKFREKMVRFAKKKEKEGTDVFSSLDEFSLDLTTEEWSKRELLEYEKEVLGELVSGTVLELFPNFFSKQAVPFKRLKIMPDRENIMAEFIVKDMLREFKIKTGRYTGQMMIKYRIEDAFGDENELTVWPTEYTNAKERIRIGYPARAECQISEFNGQKTLMLRAIKKVFGEE